MHTLPCLLYSIFNKYLQYLISINTVSYCSQVDSFLTCSISYHEANLLFADFMVTPTGLKSQIFERCRVLSRAFGHPTIQSRAHARAVAAVFYIIGKSFHVNNVEVLKALLYHWFLLSSSNSEAK